MKANFNKIMFFSTMALATQPAMVYAGALQTLQDSAPIARAVVATTALGCGLFWLTNEKITPWIYKPAVTSTLSLEKTASEILVKELKKGTFAAFKENTFFGEAFPKNSWKDTLFMESYDAINNMKTIYQDFRSGGQNKFFQGNILSTATAKKFASVLVSVITGFTQGCLDAHVGEKDAKLYWYGINCKGYAGALTHPITRLGINATTWKVLNQVPQDGDDEFGKDKMNAELNISQAFGNVACVAGKLYKQAQIALSRQA